MIKIFNIIKQKILQQIIFAFTFILCLMPKLSFAGDLLEVAKQRKWWTNDCPLDKWDDVNCFTCPLFRVLYNAASEVALASYNALHGPLEMVIVVATGVWIAVKLIKDLASYETVEPFKMIQELGYQLFRCMVVVLILHAHYASVRALTLDPVLETGMSVAQFFSGASTVGGRKMGYTCKQEKAGTVTANGGLSQSVGNSMLCAVYGVEKQAFDVIGLGATGRCLAYDRDIGYSIDNVFISFVIPSANYLMTGYLLMLIGAVYLIGCPFLLLDSVINMCFAAALLPVGVACCAFKITSSHMKTIWNTFMEGVFHFVFMTLILYVMTAGIANIISDVQAYAGKVAAGAGTFGNVVHGVSFVSINFLKLGFIFFLGWSVLEQSATLAKKFAPHGLNPGGGMGSDLGKQAATAGKRFAGGALTATGAALKAGARATGLDAKAKELRDKAAKALKSGSIRLVSAPARKARALHNSDTAKALRKQAGAGLKKFGTNAKAYLATTSLGLAASSVHNSDAAKAARAKATKAVENVASFLNGAKRNMIAANIHRNRRSQERAARMEQRKQEIKDTLFSAYDSVKRVKDNVSKKINDTHTAQFLSKANHWRKENLTLENLGEGIGYLGGAATVIGAAAMVATPGVQAAAITVLGAYGAGKVASPIVRHGHVGLEFAKSATRVGIKNLDGRMATWIHNIGKPEELRKTFNRNGQLLSEQIREDMMKNNNFDEKNQAIADKYLAQQRGRDEKTKAGREILEQRALAKEQERQQHWDNQQELHARFEQRKAEVERQKHWDNQQVIHAQFEQRKAEVAARKQAQDDAVAAALEKKQHWINSQDIHARYEQRKSAMQGKHQLYGDIDAIMNNQNLSDKEKEDYFAMAVEEEKHIDANLQNSLKPQSERDLEGLMATGLDKNKGEEDMALAMAIDKEKDEVAGRTATLTKEEEEAIRAQAGAEFDQNLTQMKEAQAAEEAAARALEEKRLALEREEQALAEAQRRAELADAEAKAAEEARIAEEWKQYEKAMKEWRKRHEQRSLMEKLLGVELTEEEIAKRERKAKRDAEFEKRWAEFSKRFDQGNATANSNNDSELS